MELIKRREVLHAKGKMVKTDVPGSIKKNAAVQRSDLPERDEMGPIGNKDRWVVGISPILPKPENAREEGGGHLNIPDGQANVMYPQGERAGEWFTHDQLSPGTLLSTTIFLFVPAPFPILAHVVEKRKSLSASSTTALHQFLGVECAGGRRRIHDKRFLDLEKRFDKARESECVLKTEWIWMAR